MEVLKISCSCGFQGIIINSGDDIGLYHCPLCGEPQMESPGEYHESIDYNIFKQL